MANSENMSMDNIINHVTHHAHCPSPVSEMAHAVRADRRLQVSASGLRHIRRHGRDTLPPMERRFFFTSPIDHDDLTGWPDLAGILRQTVVETCSQDVEVLIVETPQFDYGTDAQEAVEEMEAASALPPRQVQICLWSAIRRYGALCLALGNGIRRSERRGLLRQLRREVLRDQSLLHEHEGPYDLDSGRIYGYVLPTEDERARISLQHLLMPFDQPIYLGESWLLQATDESFDEAAYDQVAQVSPELSLFLARGRQAEEAVWRASAQSKGLVAIYPDDEAEQEIIRHFDAQRDPEIFLVDAPSAGARVTINRCQPGENLVIVYGPPFAPEIDESILFMI